jgi:hypothetical protein
MAESELAVAATLVGIPGVLAVESGVDAKEGRPLPRALRAVTVNE